MSALAQASRKMLALEKVVGGEEDREMDDQSQRDNNMGGSKAWKRSSKAANKRFVQCTQGKKRTRIYKTLVSARQGTKRNAK